MKLTSPVCRFCGRTWNPKSGQINDFCHKCSEDRQALAKASFSDREPVIVGKHMLTRKKMKTKLYILWRPVDDEVFAIFSDKEAAHKYQHYNCGNEDCNWWIHEQEVDFALEPYLYIDLENLYEKDSHHEDNVHVMRKCDLPKYKAERKGEKDIRRYKVYNNKNIYRERIVEKQVWVEIINDFNGEYKVSDTLPASYGYKATYFETKRYRVKIKHEY